MNIKTRQLIDKFFTKYHDMVTESNYRIARNIPITENNRQQVIEMEKYFKRKITIDSLLQNLRVVYTERRQLQDQLRDNTNRVELIEARLREVAGDGDS